MAGTTVAAWQAVRKEVWDSDSLEKQFYDENPWLDSIEKRQRVVIGKQAQVPVHLNRAGGTTILDNAGGNINAASFEDVNMGAFKMTYHYFPVQFEVGALNEVRGGGQSVGDSLEYTMSQAIQNLRNQITREFLTGHGHVVQLATNTSVNTLATASLASVSAGEVSGEDALGVGWLVPGDVIDIGTATDGDSLTAGGRNVTAVDEDAATITVDGAALTTSASNFVYLHGVQSGAVSTLKESGGLVTYAGTQNNVVGGIDASVEKKWNPYVDSATTTIDMTSLLKLTRKVRRKGGSGTFMLTSLYQLDNIYQLLQQQVRFAGDKEIGAGNSESVSWRGNKFHAFPQVPQNILAVASANLEEFEIVVGKFAKPTWMSDMTGDASGQGGIWASGTTHFTDTVMYALGLAVRRRNTLGAMTHLA